MALITERRRLTMQEKRAERVFDNESFERHRRTLPEYEVVPEHKSYLDLRVNNVAEDVSRSRSIFAPRNRVYEYEVVSPAPQSEILAEGDLAVKQKSEVLPSEETMKILLSEQLSAADCERMLRGTVPLRSREAVIVDEAYEEEQSERQAHITLNTKGKIAVAAYIAVILTMLIIALVTASSVATLSAHEADLKSELSAVRTEVAALAAVADELTEAELMERQANGIGMYTPTETNGGIVSVALPSLKTEAAPSVPANWFDSFCKFIAGLFGN